MNKTDGLIVGCDIELKNGHTCRVQAIGRCATCDRAFCPTHQGWDDGTFNLRGPYVDMCAPCFAEKKAEEAKRQAQDLAPYVYFESGAARTALLTAGVPPIKIYWVERRLKESFFGRREVENITFIGRGWILGKFKWGHSVTVYTGGPTEYTGVIEDCLTALLDLSHDDQLYRESYLFWTQGLARVRPYSGGYEILLEQAGFVGDEKWRVGRIGKAYREVAQAVKRLAGQSS